MVGHRCEPRVEADPLRGLHSRTKEVHHVAIGARSGRFLKELDVPAGQTELAGRDEARDARPDNHGLHVLPLTDRTRAEPCLEFCFGKPKPET